MASDIYSGSWGVAEAGYRWVEAFSTEGDGPYTVLAPRAGGLIRPYYPIRDHPSLFRDFAATPHTAENIIAFALQYGLLGRAGAFRLPEGGIFLGEPLFFWVHHIVELHWATRLWDLTKAGDSDGLGALIRWDPEHMVRPDVKGAWLFDVGRDRAPDGGPSPEHVFRWLVPPPQLPDLSHPANIVGAGREMVRAWINDRLEEHASPRLLYDGDPKRSVPRLVLRYVHRNLLGALWLQFALAIDGNRDHRACKNCGRYFLISIDEDGRTARREFCGDPCKFQDYRRRKSDARRLKDEGKSLKEIASILDSKVATVRGWLAGRKG
jgi:hypothetical protein